jgi:uncharacterized protein YqiB (DUF1249 family)
VDAVAPCPICAADEYHGAHVSEVVCHRTRHRIPELWLIGRERCHAGSPIERMSAALHDWIDQCEATPREQETTP